MLYFSTLVKMEAESGDHWSRLLNSAGLAINSTKKRSQGQTAFKVMWGRQSRHEDLLSVINNRKVDSQGDFEAEEELFAQVTPSQDELENIVFSPPLEKPLEDVRTVNKCRNNTNEKAIIPSNMSNSNRKYSLIRKSTKGGKFSFVD